MINIYFNISYYVDFLNGICIDVIVPIIFVFFLNSNVVFNILNLVMVGPFKFLDILDGLELGDVSLVQLLFESRECTYFVYNPCHLEMLSNGGAQPPR